MVFTSIYLDVLDFIDMAHVKQILASALNDEVNQDSLQAELCFLAIESILRALATQMPFHLSSYLSSRKDEAKNGNVISSIHDLLSKLEQPAFNVRANFIKFLVDQKTQLPIYCAKWAIPVCTVLLQLADEMRFAANYVKWWEWDPSMLCRAVQTLRYAIYDYFGPLARTLRRHCEANPDEKYTGSFEIGRFSAVRTNEAIETLGQVGKYCNDCQVEAELSLLQFMIRTSTMTDDSAAIDYAAQELTAFPRLMSFKDSLDDPVASNVPTATFTEVVLHNQSIIFQNLAANLDHRNACRVEERISSLLRNQSEARPERIADRAGIPRCMTIVFDKKTRLVVTGATQPVFDPDFPWLDKMGKDIHQLRLGQRFRRVVHLCTDNVARLVLDANEVVKQKTSHTNASPQRRIEDLSELLVEDIYWKYKNATKTTEKLARLPRPDTSAHDPSPNNTEDWYERMLPWSNNEGYEALPGPEKTIFCWAMDTKTLSLKRPCLRCQRIYSHWLLWDSPEDVESRREALKDLNAKDALRYDKKKDSCSYCAETVAAAKIYLLRTGKLALV